MGYTSAETRWSIIAKWKELGNLRAVARSLKVPPKTANRWVQRYLATGGVDDEQRSGRKPLLNAAVAARAHELLMSNEHGGAKSVGLLLHTSGMVSKPVDRRTVTRAVRNIALEEGHTLRALRGKPQKMLTEKNREKRLAFCKDNLGRGWGNVMFTDRKKFPFSYPGVKVQAVSWVRAGMRRQALTVNHANVVNLYAGITKSGVTKVHIVAGTTGHKTTFKNGKGQEAKNITKQEYQNVVESTFLPEGQRLFTNNGIGTWVLQQDNDPTHKAALPAVDQWNTKRGSSVSVLKNWPPNSPDLNPIENLWGYLQTKLDARGCKSFKEFRAAVEIEVKAIPTDYFSKLVGSMPTRMAECIRLEGGKTRY